MKFKSTLESHLNGILKRSGVRYAYEPERIYYTLPGYYVPDFVLDFDDGRRIYIEAKGYFRRDAQTKMRRIKEQHPELDIRFVFSAPDKRYTKWAEKYKFPYAIAVIPKEWLT